MGSPPPTTVDIDQVMARWRRRRRYGEAGLALLAVTMTLGVSFGLVHRPSTGSGLPVGSPDPAATSPPATTPRNPSRHEQDEADLAAIVLDQLRTNLPNATF